MHIETVVQVGAIVGGSSNISWIYDIKCEKMDEFYYDILDYQTTSQLAIGFDVPFFRVSYSEAVEREDTWEY